MYRLVFNHLLCYYSVNALLTILFLTPRHRLVLSGTPVQNSVGELWALFHFLMPGFLGTEKQFNARFGRAVKVARGAQKGSKDLEKGLMAAEALHKQVWTLLLSFLCHLTVGTHI
jgi:TATA-binding protein-associated factor